MLAGPAACAAPKVENFSDGDEVRYPVVLLRGLVEAGTDKLEVHRSTEGAEPKDSTGSVAGERFKALVELRPGENHLEIRGSKPDDTTKLKLVYRPMTTEQHVRLIWLTGSDGDSTFAVPDASVPQTYAQRLSTAALLMQCFTAERMQELGLGRRTFRLETDQDGQPIVHTVKAPLSGDEYRKYTDDQKLWRDIGDFLNKTMPDPKAKNIVLMSFTRKDPKTGKMLAHTALGGGNLGLFGSASMFCWPESIPGTLPGFSDSRKVDPTNVHEDSAGRGTYWAVASTTIGATLHEMGHTFGLPHCKDPRCIMTRGFDRFNRFFTLSEPWPDRPLGTFKPGQEAWFAPVSATFLRWSPWFELDKPQEAPPAKGPDLKWDSATQKLHVTAPAGIRWLGFYQDGDVNGFLAYKDSEVQSLDLTLEEIEKANGGKAPDKIVGEDSKGQVRQVGIKL